MVAVTNVIGGGGGGWPNSLSARVGIKEYFFVEKLTKIISKKNSQ